MLASTLMEMIDDGGAVMVEVVAAAAAVVVWRHDIVVGMEISLW